MTSWHPIVTYKKILSPWRYLTTGSSVNLKLRSKITVNTTDLTSKNRYVVEFLTRCIIVFIKLRFAIELTGKFPPGGCVAISLHDSYWDGVIVSTLHEKLVPVTTSKIRSNILAGWYLNRYGAIWTNDSVVERGNYVTRSGGITWIAPYGYESRNSPRSAKLPHSGAARIAISTQRPVVCVSLIGINCTKKHYLRTRLMIRVSEPLYALPEEDVSSFTSRLMDFLRNNKIS